MSKFSDSSKFNKIGLTSLKLGQLESHFEVHCRYLPEQEEVEFMLLDVTKIINSENEKAELKYKTVFLSKVAHEFKNPIVSLTELVSQSKESIADLNIHDEIIKQKIQSNFHQMLSLSEFLLVLVRDLNYFSEMTLEKEIKLEEKPTNLREIISFCENITDSLLNKTNKSKYIKFHSNIDDGLPKIIFTDEWRLKQILINLLSNAVKFTITGEIILQVTKDYHQEMPHIRFAVKDTGVGLTDEQKKNLFHPFNKGANNYNELGSGLGLCIANDLSSKLGLGLNCESALDLGTTFWFLISKKHHVSTYESKTLVNSSYTEINSNDTVVVDNIFFKNLESLKSFNINTFYSSVSLLDDVKKYDKRHLNIRQQNLTRSNSLSVNQTNVFTFLYLAT
jgi:signal transduction histidine kinase